MGGDGMGGLALAIIALMALMLVGLALAFGAVGWFAARQFGWQGGRRKALTATLALIGMTAGWLWANATFYESKFDPPPELTVRVAPGFAEPWAILLEDPVNGVPLVWRGGDIPFDAPKAEVVLPRGGVLRIRDFGQAQGRGDLKTVWSDGAESRGSGGGPAPAGLGATGYIALSHDKPGATGPGAMLPMGEALGTSIKARERR